MTGTTWHTTPRQYPATRQMAFVRIIRPIINTAALGIVMAWGYQYVRDALRPKTEFHGCVISTHDQDFHLYDQVDCTDGSVRLFIDPKKQEAQSWSQFR